MSETDPTAFPSAVTVEILPTAAVDEMVGKIRVAAAADGAPDAVARWAEASSADLGVLDGHDFAVVGTTLMYLSDAPDGLLIPHVLYPDGAEKVYTDAAHADGLGATGT